MKTVFLFLSLGLVFLLSFCLLVGLGHAVIATSSPRSEVDRWSARLFVVFARRVFFFDGGSLKVASARILIFLRYRLTVRSLVRLTFRWT